jgi:GNAT superfamily N-acetyltransferase
MDSKYEILRYKPALRDDVLALRTREAGDSDDPITVEAQWRWKYEQNPYLPEPCVVLASDSTGLVGMLGLYGSMWQFGEPPRTLLVPCPADAYVDPAHRRRGIYRRLFAESLALAAELGCEYAFSLGSAKSTYTSNLQMGARSLGYRLPAMHWPHAARTSGDGRGARLLSVPPRALRFARTRLSSAVESRRHPFALLDAGAALTGIGGLPIEVASSPRPAAMAALTAKIRSDGRIRHLKDERYLAWRFGRQHAWYRFLFLGGDELDAYAVLHSWARPGARVSVVDWEAAHPDSLADLVTAALRVGRIESIWVPWVGAPSPTTRALQRVGFAFDDRAAVQGRPPFTIEVNALRTGGDEAWTVGGRDLLDPLDWDLRLVYADGLA